MKRFLLLILSTLLLCSCTGSQPEFPVDETPATSSEFSQTEPEPEATESPEPKYDLLADLASYQSDHKVMTALSEIAADLQSSGCAPGRTSFQYFYKDLNGNRHKELAVILPCSSDSKDYALYLITHDGKTKVFPLDTVQNPRSVNGFLSVMEDKGGNLVLEFMLGSDSTIWSDKNNLHSNSRLYLDQNLNFLSHFSSVETDSGYQYYDGGIETELNLTEMIDRFADENGLISFYYQRTGYMKDQITTPEKLEEDLLLRDTYTPLDDAAEFAEEYQMLLYDFTGDGFPEMLDLSYGMEYDFDLIDFSRGYPIDLYSGELNDDDMKLYVCQDGKQRFLAWETSFFSMGGVYDFGAHRLDFAENGGFHETTLGSGVTYYTWDREDNYRYYNSSLSFLGTDLDRLGFCEDYKDLSLFHKTFTDYLAQYEIVDVISFNYEGEMSTKNPLPEFSESPKNSLIHTVPASTVRIGKKDYPVDISEITVDLSEAPDFDPDILNRFENLSSVSFTGTGTITLRDSPWCEKITRLSCNPENLRLEDGFSGFKNLRELNLSTLNEIEPILSACPGVEVFSLLNATVESKEQLQPLLSLKNLKVIVDSGHWSCLDSNIPREDWDEIIYGMFGHCLWAMLK